jgi:hypothetical protein
MLLDVGNVALGRAEAIPKVYITAAGDEPVASLRDGPDAFSIADGGALMVQGRGALPSARHAVHHPPVRSSCNRRAAWVFLKGVIF